LHALGTSLGRVGRLWDVFGTTWGRLWLCDVFWDDISASGVLTRMSSVLFSDRPWLVWGHVLPLTWQTMTGVRIHTSTHLTAHGSCGFARRSPPTAHPPSARPLARPSTRPAKPTAGI